MGVSSNGSSIFKCGCFVTLVGGIVLIVCGLVVARPGLWSIDFKETICRVNGNIYVKSSHCDCSSGDDDVCISTFPCFLVNVTYHIKDNNNNTKEVISAIHKDETIATGGSGCSFVPSCSLLSNINEERVNSFLNKYGLMNTTYSCFYNPSNEKDVIIFRQYNLAGIIASLVVPSIFFILGLLICGYGCLIDSGSKVEIYAKNTRSDFSSVCFILKDKIKKNMMYAVKNHLVR